MTSSKKFLEVIVDKHYNYLHTSQFFFRNGNFLKTLINVWLDFNFFSLNYNCLKISLKMCFADPSDLNRRSLLPDQFMNY